MKPAPFFGRDRPVSDGLSVFRTHPPSIFPHHVSKILDLLSGYKTFACFKPAIGLFDTVKKYVKEVDVIF